MVLVTLGTQIEPFTRLLDYIEHSKIKEKIIVQAGHTKYDSKKMEIFDFIDYDKMKKLISEADIVITHGGTGSIIGPLKEGKTVIACARKAKYGEHVDDHQEELVSVFKEEGYILELNEDESLDSVMLKLKEFTPRKFKSNRENFIKQLQIEIEKSW